VIQQVNNSILIDSKLTQKWTVMYYIKCKSLRQNNISNIGTLKNKIIPRSLLTKKFSYSVTFLKLESCIKFLRKRNFFYLMPISLYFERNYVSLTWNKKWNFER